MHRVLIIDDEESICWGLTKLCEQMSLEAESVSSAEQGLRLAQATSFDVIVMDVRLPGLDGISAIEQFHSQLGKVPIITITAFGDLQTAIKSIQNGAFEYIVKPFELAKVRATIQQAIATARLAKGNVAGGSDLAQPPQPVSGLVGSSSVMQEVYKQIALTTTSDTAVLITGESGTGKELTARSIHQYSARANNAFVAVNIAALSPSLVESELFGHVQGAFTGAESERVGLIQQAHGGTLFLDEVAEIPLEIQVKLLRVLDQGEVTPVGSNHPLKTDFRLVTATHQNLLSRVNQGEFRHDLLYRLRTFEIHLPPLRKRRTDISELVDFFLATGSSPSPISVAPEFYQCLMERDWPGNIRQLQSVVARAAAIARGGVLTREHVSAENDHQLNESSTELTGEIQQLIKQWAEQEWESESDEGLYESLIRIVDPAVLSAAFLLSDQNYSTAAKRLGIHRTTLKKKLDDISNG